MAKKRRLALFGNLLVMIIASILVAISIICGKYLAIPGGNVLRFSFENLPIMLAGIAFGPVVGAVVGVAADLIGCVLVGYQINPILTLAAALIGVLSALIFRLCRRSTRLLPLAATVFGSHLVGSVVIKTLGLAAFYDLPVHVLMLWRLLNYLIVGALELAVLSLLLRNQAIRRQLLPDTEK